MRCFVYSTTSLRRKKSHTDLLYSIFEALQSTMKVCRTTFCVICTFSATYIMAVPDLERAIGPHVCSESSDSNCADADREYLDFSRRDEASLASRLQYEIQSLS